MPTLFISYRRQDSQDITGRMSDRLKMHFGDASVFMDIENIPVGADFRTHIDSYLKKTDVILLIIGDRWLKLSDATGSVRLFQPHDFVRSEIESALALNIPIIPVLVGQALMPCAEQLPPSIRSLAYRNAIECRSGSDFNQHIQRLIRTVEQQFGGNKKSPKGSGNSPALTPRVRPASATLMVFLMLGLSWFGYKQWHALSENNGHSENNGSHDYINATENSPLNQQQLNALLPLSRDPSAYLLRPRLNPLQGLTAQLLLIKNSLDQLSLGYPEKHRDITALDDALTAGDLVKLQRLAIDLAFNSVAPRADFYINLANIYLVTLQFSQAGDAFNLAGDLSDASSAHAETFIRLGTGFLNLNKPQQALRQFSLAQSLGAEKTELYQGLGHSYFAIKDYENAYRFYRKAYQHYIQNNNTHNNTQESQVLNHQLDQALAQLKLKEFDAATSDAQQALAIGQSLYGEEHSLNALSKNIIGEAAFYLGDYETALIHHEDALAICKTTLTRNHPLFASTLYHLAHTYQALGQVDIALDFLHQSLPILDQQQQTNPPIFLEASTLFFNLAGRPWQSLPSNPVLNTQTNGRDLAFNDSPDERHHLTLVDSNDAPEDTMASMQAVDLNPSSSQFAADANAALTKPSAATPSSLSPPPRSPEITPSPPNTRYNSTVQPSRANETQTAPRQRPATRPARQSPRQSPRQPSRPPPRRPSPR